MKTKLSLRLNEEILERAKKYARENKTSLSRIVESYLEILDVQKDSTNSSSITPFIESLSGVINMPMNLDLKNEYNDYLEEKYI